MRAGHLVSRVENSVKQKIANGRYLEQSPITLKMSIAITIQRLQISFTVSGQQSNHATENLSYSNVNRYINILQHSLHFLL